MFHIVFSYPLLTFIFKFFNIPCCLLNCYQSLPWYGTQLYNDLLHISILYSRGLFQNANPKCIPNTTTVAGSSYSIYSIRPDNTVCGGLLRDLSRAGLVCRRSRPRTGAAGVPQTFAVPARLSVKLVWNISVTIRARLVLIGGFTRSRRLRRVADISVYTAGVLDQLQNVVQTFVLILEEWN